MNLKESLEEFMYDLETFGNVMMRALPYIFIAIGVGGACYFAQGL